MSRWILLAASAIALVGALGLNRSGAHAAPATETWTREGTVAGAAFVGASLPANFPEFGGYSVDSFVTAEQFTITSGSGTTTDFSTLFLDAFVYDPETFEPALSCVGASEPTGNQFAVNGLQDAALDASVEVTCERAAGGDPLVVVVDFAIEWTPTVGRSSSHHRSRNEFWQGQFSARGVQAEITGVITIGGIAGDAYSPDAFIDTFRERVRCFTADCFF